MSATNTMSATDGNPTKVDETKQDMAHMDAMMQASTVQSQHRGGPCDACTRSVNLLIENSFYKLGECIGKCPCIVLIIVLIVLILCCFGLNNLEMEQDITNLWTPTDSPIWDERVFIDKYWGNEGGGNLLFVAESRSDDNDGNILSKQHLREWYAFNVRMKTEIPTIDYIYTDDEGTEETITFGLFYEDFYPIIDLDTLGEMGADHEKVQHYASRVIPFCKPGGFSPLEAQFQLPCAMLTIFDCFSEGGTFFPYDNYLAKTFFASIAPANPYTYLRSSFEALDDEGLSELVGLSCPVFSGDVQPFNNIYGGDVRVDPDNETSPVLSLKTWESVVLMDSPYGLAKKIKIATKQCNYTVTFSFECPEITEEDVDEAHKLYNEWQLKVIDWGLAEIADTEKNPLLKISMWLDRSGPDLLREASSADFILLFIAYFSMIIFASLTAFRPQNLFLSKSEASCFGVILVLMAVLGTMGLGSSFNTLSPEAVQVLPFIALGFGVDDMFVLMFAYKFRKNLTAEQMVAETVRVAGSSVALTSIANCLAFIIATQMVLPSVANFAVFGALVVTLNFIAVIFGFTAILALVAKRQLGGYRDCAFCCCFSDCTKYKVAGKVNASSPSTANAENPESPSASSTDLAVMTAGDDSNDNASSIFEPVFDILIKTPVRLLCIFLCLILFIIGIVGIGSIEVGLPLSEIVPSDSYAADFLKVRTRYYFTHSFSLYSDANGAKLDNIDWANKFGEFLELTDDLHSISPLIYDGFATHTFWARSLRDYLIKSKDVAALSNTGTYKLGSAVDVEALLAGDTIIRSNLCESDRKKFCPAVAVKYFWNKQPSIPSPLVACLFGNKDYLETDCFNYLVPMLPDSFFADYTWAHQLYIESYDINKANITGLYVKSSADTVNVYYKYPCNDIQCDGYIFQSNENKCGDIGDNGDCPWYLLDGDFNLIYIGEGTPISLDATDLASLDSIPSQTGWKDPVTDRPAYITQNYMDFPVFAAGGMRDLSNFIMRDVDIITTFHYSGHGKYEWLLMKKLMSTSVTAYKSVSLGPYNSPIACDAVLEASEICGAIKDSLSFGYINCGGIEESAKDTNWWIGNCSNDDYVVVATSINSATITDITAEEACQCTDNNKDLNHIKSIKNDDDLDCFNPTETISITCSQFTSCNSLSSCYEEFEKFAIIDNKKQCNVSHLQQYEIDYGIDGITRAAADNLAICLFSYYDSLSDCCQESITSILLIDDIDFTCSDINQYVSNNDASEDAKKAVCNARDKCSYNTDSKLCENLCYGSVFADCSDIIYQTHDYGFHFNVLGNQLVTDFNTLQLLASLDPSSCCWTALNDAVIAGTQNCSIPKAGYFNFITFKYDYDVCTDSIIANVSCGTSYDNSDSFDLTTFSTYFTTVHGQAACLYANIDDLPDGCCKNVINEIGENSFILTKECEADAQILCGNKGGESSFAIGMYNESSQCAKSIISAAGQQTLSPKCLSSFAFCQSVDNWPATFGNTNASILCDDGYEGYQIRRCIMPSGSFADWSKNIDISNCTMTSCGAEIGPFGQSWPQTLVGYIATAQGGYVATDNINQVGETLQGELSETCSYFQPPLYTIPFARRKCEISSIDGTAIWKTPIVECRPGIFKTWTNIKEKTVCDMLSESIPGLGTGANIIKVVPWSYVLGEDKLYELIVAGKAEEECIAYSQQYCEQVLSNCAAFSYDSSKYMSYFFDYCGNLLTAEYLNGSIPIPWSNFGLNTFADTMTTYIAPLSLSQFTAEYCSAMSLAAIASGDTSRSFIPASEAWSDLGIPHPFCFDNILFLYYVDPLGGVLSQDNIEFSVPYSDINISNTHIVCTKNSFTIGNMRTDQDAVDIIVSTRKRLAEWKDSGFPVIPGGFIISFYSQYIGVSDYLVTNLIFVTIAVIIVGFIFLINPIAVLVCICCNIMMIVEVYGFSHYVGLKINGVLVLNIVIAIGLTMEFTAHIGRAYVLTTHSYGNMELSEGQNRMKKTLKEMFVPVTLGAITTIIGIAPVSAANFPYFKLYYFNLYVIIVTFGWLNGVIFQPIILSFYPPKSFEMEEKTEKPTVSKQQSVELGTVAI